MRLRVSASAELAGPVRPSAGRGVELPAALRAKRAANQLLEVRPDLSAARGLWPWQRGAFITLALSIAAGALFLPRETLVLLLAVLALPFLCVVALRAVALSMLLPRSAVSAPARPEPAGPGALPRYSVLVPLFREADVVPGLVTALKALDYPPDQLEILLIVESIDAQTRAALAIEALPSHMTIVEVPDGAPRTKPRALNYALQTASGTCVVVYDAEDWPDPDQLRRAAAALADGHGRIGCLQARLEIYNPNDNWFTRQFTIEYAALFGALLPALERLRLPVPLGGTSNHFPRAVLDEIGGWDPFNVTEDADLGIRLARAGYSVRILDSATSEEAPAQPVAWLKQRTRWLKGWMQTYLVHMRDPARLWRELGPRAFFGLQVLMGGMLLSALVHPWFYVLMAADLLPAAAPGLGAGGLATALWWIGIVNLVAGYATAALLGAFSAARLGGWALARHSVWMPVYWLFISAAAYRALWQLVTAPFHWEKTTHGRRLNAPPAQPPSCEETSA